MGFSTYKSSCDDGVFDSNQIRKVYFSKVTSCIVHLHPPAVLVMAFKSKLEGYNEAEELLGYTLNVTPRLFFIVTNDLE